MSMSEKEIARTEMGLCVIVCVCVCVREREIERETVSEIKSV